MTGIAAEYIGDTPIYIQHKAYERLGKNIHVKKGHELPFDMIHVLCLSNWRCTLASGLKYISSI